MWRTCIHGGKDIIAIIHVLGTQEVFQDRVLGGARLNTWLLGRVSVGLMLAREHYPTYPLKYWHEGSPSSIQTLSCCIDSV